MTSFDKDLSTITKISDNIYISGVIPMDDDPSVLKN